MKPLSELVKELREKEAFSHINISAKRAAGIGYAAAKLQAWLREADKFAETQQGMNDATAKNFSSWGTANEAWTNAWMITRQYLLGTTRTEGSPEKLSLKGKK
jgi:hypothetical protein